ncbi:MAG: replicative DNA helicase [Janthinobacterium lividum]
MNAPIQNLDRPALASTEAEQYVIGALLLDNDAFDRIGDLKAEHFYTYEHRLIYEAILRLVMANRGADVMTVSDAMQSNGKSGGDVAYLHSLSSNTPGAANIARYADIVRDRAIKRGIVAMGHEIADLAEKPGQEASELVDLLTSKLELLAQSRVKQEPVLASDDLIAHIERIDNRYHGIGEVAISTGFVDIDRKLNGGLRRGGLYVIAARPKMGKTAFALNIAINLSVDHSVLIQSMEMPKSEIHDRNLAALGRIPLDHLLDPTRLTDADWPAMTNAIMKIRDMKLYLDDQGGCTLMDIRMKAKQVKRRSGLDALVIDYLQLMNGQGDNRNAQIEAITRGLKALAKELNIVVILLSQLNRKVEERPNKRPMPSDLRDSGSIEQDADVVMFLYRDEMYNPDSQDKGTCEVNIPLNRQGAPGTVALTYFGEQTRFESLGRVWQPPPPKTPSRRSSFDD